MDPPPASIVRADEKPEILKEIGIDQRLGQALPLDLAFRDDAGRTVRLGNYFGKRPVILALVYYNCPMLCTQVLNGLVASLNVMSLSAGSDFDVVAVSFDPRETPEMARAKKEAYLSRYQHPAAAAGWHFLTGAEPEIRALAKAAGFRFRYDPRLDQFAHASGIFVATPDGALARYFYGIEYAPATCAWRWSRRPRARSAPRSTRSCLYCFHYDPASGKYGAVVVHIVRLAGAATVVLVPLSLWILSRRRARFLQEAGR